VREKLDPRLLELIEQADAGLVEPSTTVDVLVGLDVPIDASIRSELASRGLSLRSAIGTVLTGSIRVVDAERLAASERIVKLESSAPLYREPSRGGEG
jgi:hypothetical protein